jgi:ABC-type branched-subunit amino acid transport system ATPase component
MSALLEVQGLGKRFGGFVALDGIDLSVTQGERLGLIGPNGSGKSTLVNCMCGTLQNETGTVHFDISTAIPWTGCPPTCERTGAWRAASSSRGRSSP